MCDRTHAANLRSNLSSALGFSGLVTATRPGAPCMVNANRNGSTSLALTCHVWSNFRMPIPQRSRKSLARCVLIPSRLAMYDTVVSRRAGLNSVGLSVQPLGASRDLGTGGFPPVSAVS